MSRSDHDGSKVTRKSLTAVTAGGDDVGVAGVTAAVLSSAAEGDGELKFDEEVGGGKLLIHPRIGLITGAADNEVGEGPMKDYTTAFEC